MDTSQKFELRLAKGMRDRAPQDKILQMSVLDTIREVFELYGYLPFETPIVERMDILQAKFAAGEGTDVSKEIFKVTDQGNRELGLRFDMTVPLARYVAMNPTVKLPFKRYVIGKVFRDGPLKLGRYREFWQADADIIGVPGHLADVEGVSMAADVFSRLGLDVTLYLNSREILHEIMDLVKIDHPLKEKAIIALDKLRKIGHDEVLKEMVNGGIDSSTGEELLKLVDLEGTNEEKIEILGGRRGILRESDSLKRLRDTLGLLSHIENIVFDPSLARGLGYYTGFFFECFHKNSRITSSLVGTGRYDRLIGEYLLGKQEFAGVGISFGVSVICDALREMGKMTRQSLTDVYIVPISANERAYALEISGYLRKSGINTDMDLLGRSIGKNFSYANAMGIPQVVVLGENEMRDQTCTLKQMSSGHQETMKTHDLIEKLRSTDV